MKNWSNVIFKDIAEFNPRESIKKGEVAVKVGMDKLQPFCRDIPLIEYEAFSGGTKFRNGDTIMARITPCLENGKTAMVNVLKEGQVGFGSTEFIVIRAKKGMTDPHFLYYLVCSPTVREPAIKSMVGSSGRQRVQTDVVQNLEFKIPSLADQEKIGDFLKKLDDKISINNKINRNLSEQANALYKSWFVDFEPFNGERPVDWLDGTVDDLASEIVCGKTPSTKKEEYYGEDIPFVTIPDMHGCVYTVHTERALSELGAESQSKKTLPKNSICVSCIGTAGLVTLLPVPSQTNQQINSIIPKANYSPYYIYLLMNTMGETISKLGQAGSTIVNLNKTQFGKMDVLIPSVKSMKEFDEIVEPMFCAILLNQIENIGLANIRDSLLPKLMSAELDVSNLDI